MIFSAEFVTFIFTYLFEWYHLNKEIRKFIKNNCLTKEGAYATYPGSEKVDITAALFPVWLFTEPDSPEMKKTISILENKHRDGQLSRRTLTRKMMPYNERGRKKISKLEQWKNPEGIL